MTDQPPVGGNSPAQPESAPAGSGHPGAAKVGQAQFGKSAGVDTAVDKELAETFHVTQDLRRRAGAMFNASTQVGEDVVGRDKISHFHLGAGAAARSPQPLSEPFLNELRQTFVPPSRFPDLTGTAEDNRLVILQADVGSGRRATALRLLLEYYPPHDIREFDPGFDVGEVSREDLVEGVGHLLCDLPDATARALHGFVLQGLEARLAARNARLVITVDRRAALGDDDAYRYVADVGTPPAAADVVASNLSARLAASSAESVFSQASHLVDELIGPGAPISRAASLGRHLAAETDSAGVVDVARVRSRFRDGHTNLESWFTGLPDLAARSFAMAIAVLNGLPYETVAAAAYELHHVLDASVVPQVATAPDALRAANTARPEPSVTLSVPTDRLPDPFQNSRSAQLRRLHAHVTSARMPTMYGDVPIDVVSFDDETYPRRVLEWVWQEYDEVRPPFARWLYQLGTHPNIHVRVYAAAAVGALATRTFEAMLRSVIAPWAQGTQRRARDAAAFALHAPATDGLYDHVLKVVRDWASQHHSDDMRATAALAYGASIGDADLEEAITALGRLARTSYTDEVARAVGYALADLISLDQRNLANVLSALREWASERVIDLRKVAHFAFLVVASVLVTSQEQLSDNPDPADPRPAQMDWPPWLHFGDEELDWPTLLLRADTEPSNTAAIAWLWHESLNGPALGPSARQVLSRWAKRVDAWPLRCAALGRLAVAVAQDPRTGGADSRTERILRRLAASWVASKNPEPAPNAAAAVLAALNRGVGQT